MIRNNPLRNSIFNRRISPVTQAFIVVGFGVVGMLLIKVVFGNAEPIFYWELAFAMCIVYSLFNCLLSFTIKERIKYFRDSIFVYIAVVAAGISFANLFSGLNVYEADAFHHLFIIFTFAYILLLVLVNTMKKIIELAKKT